MTDPNTCIFCNQDTLVCFATRCGEDEHMTREEIEDALEETFEAMGKGEIS